MTKKQENNDMNKKDIRCDLQIGFINPITDFSEYSRNDEFLYMLLSRLKMDCNFYLGSGNRDKTKLWAGDENDHINEMKAIHNYLEIKPEWLTMKQIIEFEKQFAMNENGINEKKCSECKGKGKCESYANTDYICASCNGKGKVSFLSRLYNYITK